MRKLQHVEPICRLPAPPPAWHEYDYEELDNGRLVLVRVNIDVASMARHERGGVLAMARLRLTCFDGVTKSDVLKFAAAPWPKVDKIPGGKLLGR